MILKSGFLISWLALIITGWLALRNYGLGLSVGLNDPVSLGFFATAGVFLLSCGLMLRYMPPYKTLSLKRTIVRSGFGGILLLTKAAVIYVGICLTLAGHPVLRDTLFCQNVFAERSEQAKHFAHDAARYRHVMARLPVGSKEMEEELVMTLNHSPFKEIPEEQSSIVKQALLRDIPDYLLPSSQSEMAGLINIEVGHTDTANHAGHNGSSNYLLTQNLTALFAVKIVLACLLLLYPEVLAYLFLAMKSHSLAFKTFDLAVRIKEYFLGANHWLVIGMMQFLGTCLLSFDKKQMAEAGENYIKEAVHRYERSRGRHDQFTIEAKMQLAKIFSDRGDYKEAERILLEALRDVAKDFDMLAHCALLAEIGRLAGKQKNVSRAKQMYKQVIEQLEQYLSLKPTEHGMTAYWRNLYAATPGWMFEVHLINAYLDLAKVFQQAKYSGEEQRLIDDANKRIGAFEKDTVVSPDIVSCYIDARLAYGRILGGQRRFDECVKLLAAARHQIYTWGYTHSRLYFKFLVSECEMLWQASKAFPVYEKDLQKSLTECRRRFGFIFKSQKQENLEVTLYGYDAESCERWHALSASLATFFPESGNASLAPVEEAPGWLSIGPSITESDKTDQASQTIKITRPPDSIISRWQQELRDEKMLEWRPEQAQA